MTGEEQTADQRRTSTDETPPQAGRPAPPRWPLTAPDDHAERTPGRSPFPIIEGTD